MSELVLKLKRTLPKTLENYLLQHMQTPEKRAQNTTLAARKTGDGIFLRKLKDILGVQEADKRISYTFQEL